MHLIYLDESKDVNADAFVYSALCIPGAKWLQALNMMREFRSSLRDEYGIYVNYELHATKFVGGRGHPAPHKIDKAQRADIFLSVLDFMTTLPDAQLFNSHCAVHKQQTALEWLINRFEKNMEDKDSYAILIFDEGERAQHTKLIRKMRRWNPVSSQYGQWRETRETWKNIPLARIVEDPVFRDSAESYFIQLVDFSAYALLRQENPLPSKSRYGIDKAFDILDPILVKEATRKDERGIIRP